MRRLFLSVATAAVALTASACGDSTGIGTNIAGSYELRTINGQSLPVTLNGRTYEAGELEIDNNGDANSGDFVETLQFRDFGSGFSDEEAYFGTWDRNGSELEFFYESGARFFGERISSSRIVLQDSNGNEWLYQRF